MENSGLIFIRYCLQFHVCFVSSIAFGISLLWSSPLVPSSSLSGVLLSTCTCCNKNVTSIAKRCFFFLFSLLFWLLPLFPFRNRDIWFGIPYLGEIVFFVFLFVMHVGRRIGTFFFSLFVIYLFLFVFIFNPCNGKKLKLMLIVNLIAALLQFFSSS